MCSVTFYVCFQLFSVTLLCVCPPLAVGQDDTLPTQPSLSTQPDDVTSTDNDVTSTSDVVTTATSPTSLVTNVTTAENTTAMFSSTSDIPSSSSVSTETSTILTSSTSEATSFTMPVTYVSNSTGSETSTTSVTSQNVSESTANSSTDATTLTGVSDVTADGTKSTVATTGPTTLRSTSASDSNASTPNSTNTPSTSLSTTRSTPTLKPTTKMSPTRTTPHTGRNDGQGAHMKDSDFGRYGLPVAMGLTVLCLILVIVLILLLTQRARRKHAISGEERGVPKLRMLEIKDSDDHKAVAMHDDLHTYSLDYEKHVQDRIEQHKRTTSVKENKIPQNNASTGVEPSKPGVSTFMLAKKYNLEASVSSSPPTSPTSPTTSQMTSHEQTSLIKQPTIEDEATVFNFNAKRPSELLTCRRTSNLDNSNVPSKGKGRNPDMDDWV